MDVKEGTKGKKGRQGTHTNSEDAELRAVEEEFDMDNYDDDDEEELGMRRMYGGGGRRPGTRTAGGFGGSGAICA